MSRRDVVGFFGDHVARVIQQLHIDMGRRAQVGPQMPLHGSRNIEFGRSFKSAGAADLAASGIAHLDWQRGVVLTGNFACFGAARKQAEPPGYDGGQYQVFFECVGKTHVS